MNKRHYLFLAALLIVSGCSDDGNSSQDDPITPNPCDQCGPDQLCVDDVCTTPQPEAKCDPDCKEGETCVNGKCGICIGNECFFEGGEDDDLECESNQDCGEGKYCHDGVCETITEDMCVPSCATGQTCVKGECVNSTLLWSLCQSTSDCGSGECIFFATPSKMLKLGDNTYDTNNPIPINELDSRINVENYNLTHNSQASPDATIGICSYDCTKQENKVCPSGWTCQVVAKGELPYPGLEALPSPVPEADAIDTPFAAVCRRDIDDLLAKDLPYNKDFCATTESDCKESGSVFYENMCLAACDNTECPYFFSCDEVDVNGSTKKLCVPQSGTCTSCYDHDGDGAGYGHCERAGIDCDDDNPKAYYQKELDCNDIYQNGTAAKTDFNCNGIIDKFEMFGTPSSCNACGSACNKPNSEFITVECVDTSNALASNWRNSADMDMELPEFACIETCSFGYGDCRGDTKCSTRLLSAGLIESAKTSDNVQIRVTDVISSDTTAQIYALDADGDGFPMADVAKTQAPDDPADRTVVLSGDNSVICCAQNAKYCYTANADWQSIKLSDAPKSENERYVSPEMPNLPSSYDIDDTNKKVNPKAIEQCDGLDNDGSTLLSGALAQPCDEWCAQKAPANATEEERAYYEKIESICDKISNDIGDGKKVTYTINAYCDATQDGLNDTAGWKDRADAEGKTKFFGDQCTIRQTNDNVCSESGTITCQPAPHNSCLAGANDCKCATDGHAFRITANNRKVDPLTGKVTYDVNEADYVKNVIVSASGITTEKCLCNGTHCDEATDECDSNGCYEACNRLCTTALDHALSCTTNDESSLLDGIDESGKLVLDGIDDDCDGRIDEDAIQPCLITANFEAARLAEGITDPDHYSITGYDISKAYNKDKSLNLCRIGVLKSRLEGGKYIPVCYPLFNPRSYDFYGDGVDSNCDGVDYDIDHTVFVSLAAQGNTNASDENTCKFDPKESYLAISPCATLDRAIEAAADGSHYNDILIAKEESGVKFSTADKQSLLNIATLGSHSPVKQGYVFSGSGLPNEPNHVQNGHILSAQKLHQLLVNKLKANASFKPNLYRFSYDRCDYNTTTKEYTCTSNGSEGEQNQPDEVIRIYGGFTRTANDRYDMKSEHDMWSHTSSTSISKIIWDIIITKDTDANKLLYSMVLPTGTGKLSLLLDHMQLEMTSTAKSDVSGSAGSSLPSKFANGVTFIGINASKSGASLLTLNDSTLTVKAPAGYSYSTSHNNSLNGTNGTSEGKRADRDENDKSGWDDDYVKKYKENTCKKNNTVCGINQYDEVNQSYGGCGGYSKTDGRPYDYINGKQPYQSYSGISLPNAGTSSGLGGGDDWYCPKVSDVNRGKNGSGGTAGAAGSQKNIKMNFATNSDGYLYVASNRRDAKGYYGYPGAGGGGGAVFQCWKGNGSDHTQCYGASGGDGGCGGEGGQAGGTGGSALGIVLKSDGSTTTLRITPESPTTVSVTPGNGGMPEQGGIGGSGTRGGFWYGYSRCSGTAAFCSDTQNFGGGSSGAGGGGGAGGNGAGGLAGWTFPYVLYCANSNSNITLPDLKNASTSCGFDIASPITNDPTRYGTQNHGQAYADSAKGANGAVGTRTVATQRWSRDSNSSESGERGKCGGSYEWDTVVANGGAGGNPQQVETTQYEDMSCTYKVGSQDVNTIIKIINSTLK